jgi:hypothetical protein
VRFTFALLVVERQQCRHQRGTAGVQEMKRFDSPRVVRTQQDP